MNIKGRLQEIKDHKSYSLPATRVIENLKPILSSKSDLYKKRWIWELLQNASDLGKSISVEIKITNEFLTFKHNGKAFTLKEAYNLIMPETNKDENDVKSKSPIGQFGTGFISTHILSCKIDVEGMIHEGNDRFDFKFSLDRSNRKNKESIIESIKKSESEYHKNIQAVERGDSKERLTSFTYHLNETYSNISGLDVVDVGLKCFHDLIPFVFTFRPHFSEIKIIDKRKTEEKTIIVKNKNVENEFEELSINRITWTENGMPYRELLIGSIKVGESQIAFPIKNAGNAKYEILPFPETSSRMFCAFPLIGAEDFGFPVFFNSVEFVPNKERDGIDLSQHDTENRERISEATDAFLILLDLCERFEWTKAYNISGLTRVEIGDSETNAWFSNFVFNRIKESIYKAKIMSAEASDENGDIKIALERALVPYSDRRLKNKQEIIDKIHGFASVVFPEDIPSKLEYKHWYNILDFEIFEKEKLDLPELCRRIDPKGDLAGFAEETDKSAEEALDYFIELAQFVVDSEEYYLFNEYNLLLNQSNEFSKQNTLYLDRTEEMTLEEEYIEKMKDVFNSISNQDCRAQLLHKEFERFENIIDEGRSFDFKELAKDTDEEIRNYEGSLNDHEFKVILKDMFNWYSNCGLSDDTLSNLFPFFSSNKSHLFLSTKTPKDLDYAFEIEISGKSEVLSRIAKSEITIQELETIAQNPSAIADLLDLKEKKGIDILEKLADLNEEIELVGRDKVERFIANEKEKTLNFRFKKAIGDSFERLFKEYFESKGLNFIIEKREGLCDYNIKQGESTYYVELKSVKLNSNEVKMTYNQGLGAVRFKKNYSLCVLERPENWNAIKATKAGMNYIKENSKSVLSIGTFLEDALKLSKEFKDRLIENEINGIGVEMTDEEMKFRISRDIWQKGSKLDKLLSHIISYFSKK
jgi:hypothetical protein